MTTTTTTTASPPPPLNRILNNRTGYSYTPLCPDRFNIRLLKLVPASHESDPISCTLTTHMEGNGSNWTCLSYCWGTEPATQAIRLDNTTVLVRPNLHDFLQEARRRGLTSPLWIDSLSINQADVEERNSQVELMSRIYRKASQVIAWLGLGRTVIEDALRKLDFSLPPKGTRVSFAVANQVLGALTPDECSAMFEVCSNWIWTRLWVKQELLLPEEPVMWYGAASVAVPVFFTAIEALVDYDTVHSHRAPPSPSSTPPSTGEASSPTQQETPILKCKHGDLNLSARALSCEHVTALTNIWKDRRRQKLVHDLPTMLETFKTSACTDFHDYIYAFRGLNGAKRNTLHVNYESSAATLLCQTLDFIARTSHARLLGATSGERSLLANLYRGLQMTREDLEELFWAARYSTKFVVQCGETLELGRKTVKVWTWVDSIPDVEEFAAQAWRQESMCSSCYRLLERYNVSLNQLVIDSESTAARDVWLYGLGNEHSPDLRSLRAAYDPQYLYAASEHTVDLVNRLTELDRDIMALAFEPPDGDDQALPDWLMEKRDHFVVTIGDSDDAGLALHFSTFPACKSAKCLLQEL